MPCRPLQALLLFFCANVCLADITEIEPLAFGRIAIIDNDSPEYISISHVGVVSTSGSILVIERPEVGEFLFSNLPAYQRLNLSARPTQATSSSVQYSSEQFRLTAIDLPSAIDTDGNGEARIQVGGTLSTSGSGSTRYIDTQYRIRYQITIDY
ncbi:DUF4402 domain-containing protein [Marinomonas ostreistagni]|uniref:DUF4402 domain-containing protein n=1 Tax=Marinomonas ostreistagni TaxID=359209 RepID=UPI0019523338|nr:DUF4402 domain-containing protein [Marinomonas ostreistagni]MBM6549636.1 DUF4402 domain-containing protein [Marinomonas ostreistagni]